MTLKGHNALRFKTRASVGAHCENSVNPKIDLHCHRRRCSPMTLVSGNIRCVPIFEGVHWTEGVKQQWSNRKHGFSRLSTLRLQHVKKWDEHYILLFNPLSPFHWPRNVWLWLTLNGLNGHYTLETFTVLRCAICLRVVISSYLFTVEYVYARHVTRIQVREVEFRIVIRRIFWIGETLHRRNVIKIMAKILI